MDAAARDGFLKAILADRRNDTIRLAYADWLDENADSPVDRATSEFIRASCRVGGKYNLMAKSGYDWLEGNWKRLVPSVVALHAGYDDVYPRLNCLRGGFRAAAKSHAADPLLLWGRVGRWVEFCGWAKTQPPGEYRSRFRIRLEFWKGFLTTWHIWGVGNVMRPAVDADQPILALNGGRQIHV